ncbi:efflux RND transporter periplasmic adaptor subunit [Micromonospora sp. NPDC050417]|uniref:efflux RND transporter periplasmic adaptor subunit n=1 Tax=Micromonospora sp. NPDC050417 TaxID=3364280 RepID=UPI0037A9F20A
MRSDPPRRRYLKVVIPAVVLAGLVAAAGIVWTGRGSTAPPVAEEPTGVQSIALVKQDISTSQSLSGSLGYGTPRMVKGGKDATVTWLPSPGTSVKRGQQLYRIDDRPVPLFYGGMPLFRPLTDLNMTGRDVWIVADNLRALGYAIGNQPAPGTRLTPSSSGSARVTVQKGDGVLTAALRDAVKRWQSDLKVPVTGTIEPGDVAVFTGAVRVDSVAVEPGDSANVPLMSVTPTAKVITVQADLGNAGSIEQGDKVTVRLPDESKVGGAVATVGTTVTGAAGDPGAGGTPPKVTVTITIDQPATVDKINFADVQVEFVAETHKGILVAPVGALLALSEGGYAVQVEGGALVAVETGIFAKGFVEIKGDGLAEGTKVVTTS